MVRKNLIILQETDSTNNYARGLIQAKEAEEGTAVLAYSQVKGRGQGTNIWESQPCRNLTVSFIFQPSFLSPGKQFYILMIAALSANELFSRYISETRIKWPNDLYWRNKKAGGILIENIFLGNSFEFSIIGFGLNINQEKFYSDAPNPVSLKQITGQEFIIDTIFYELDKYLNYWYAVLKEGGSEKIRNTYHSNLYLRNELSTFRTSARVFRGMIIGVDESGLLMIKDEGGKIAFFDFKEIEFVCI